MFLLKALQGEVTLKFEIETQSADKSKAFEIEPWGRKSNIWIFDEELRRRNLKVH
ncbi:hypothetical protein HYD55_03975 [Mycoplasmopsis bovis]|nr:hypothetical protein [Mycoplasmopsis bovis]QQH71703.1 hypothetical protein HYD55_03975 [Mycoplasmopsis bovis]